MRYSPAVLFTLDRGGQEIPAIGHANKNGYYYILDRRDGTPPGFTAVPVYTPPQEKPLLIQPGFEGGPTWCPRRSVRAQSILTFRRMVTVRGCIARPSTLLTRKVRRAEGAVPGVTDYRILDAVDTTTGKIAWHINTPQRLVTGITIAGDLGFYGESNGRFNAFDAESGKVLWSYRPNEPNATGANGAPAVFTMAGREYVAMASAATMKHARRAHRIRATR